METSTDAQPTVGPWAVPAGTQSGQPVAAGHDPRWVRAALLTLLAATAGLNLWGLSASGYANSFYAAAVQAGTQSWKAMFFGSLDPGNLITVDKTPASLWVMELSGRIFGFSSWSMLAPQALEGVAAVGLLYATVRRWSGPTAGLLAGAALAATPVATLMFRFNNPDALLTLLLVAGAYAMVRALERGRTGWLLLAGAAVGFGFLTKMLQAFLVVPAFALAYLIAAPTPVRRRVLQLLASGATLIAAGGWWVAVVELLPASARPYVGGSTDNDILQLALGYNGLSRLTGGSGPGGGPSGGGPSGGGPSGGGPGGAGNLGFGGAPGVLRMFGDSFGTQISWLLPAALIGLAAGLWWRRAAPRTDRVRAALLLWGGWLLVTAGVFSLMSGIVHAYYSIALAPAVAATVAVSGRELWRHRDGLAARIVLALMVAATAVWSWVLLDRDAGWHPELRVVLVLLAVIAVAALLAPLRRGRVLTASALASSLLVGGLGSTAYAVQTASSPHSGSIPTAGPASAGGFGPGRGAFGGPGQQPGGQQQGGGQPPGGQPPGGQAPGGTGGPGVAGGPGITSGAVDSQLVNLLKASKSTWAAATVGAQAAAGLELASGASVIGIGGFTGSDPAPTLAQFQALVSAGRIHYFVTGGAGGLGGGPGGGGIAAQITSWVQQNFTATTVGSQTVYDLTSGRSSSS